MLLSKNNRGRREMVKLAEVMQRLFAHSATAGLCLLAAATAALALANSSWAEHYYHFLETSVILKVGSWQGGATIEYAINDGLMAIFFFLVSLEIKREIIDGELSTRAQALLPCIAALGGVVAPAIIYAAFTAEDAIALRGWAIPAATDIAFSLGVLALLGSRVPVSLKIFLTTLAVVDDLIAILIIALFYTSNLDISALLGAGVCVILLAIMNRARLRFYFPYLFVGFWLWWLVLQSGVHATLAGVVLGLFIPMSVRDKHDEPMLVRLEHGLQPWVAFFIMPAFAFANAGLLVEEEMLTHLMNPITLGVALGLLIGKPLGIGLATGFCVWRGWVKLPRRSNWMQMMAVACLAGIGFTMSLFINHLAFDGVAPMARDVAKMGVLLGSTLSVLLGCLIFFAAPEEADENAAS